MRTTLALLALVCIVALPLAASSEAPAASVEEAPTVDTTPAPASAFDSLVPTELEKSMAADPGQSGRCQYCIDYCMSRYPGSPGGYCVGTGCICII